jgi:hypothetical protein
MSSIIDQAAESLAELANQREMLKVSPAALCLDAADRLPVLSTQGTQRRVLDMLTTLGVSSSTIRTIGAC